MRKKIALITALTLMMTVAFTTGCNKKDQKENSTTVAESSSEITSSDEAMTDVKTDENNNETLEYEIIHNGDGDNAVDISGLFGDDETDEGTSDKSDKPNKTDKTDESEKITNITPSKNDNTNNEQETSDDGWSDFY